MTNLFLTSSITAFLGHFHPLIVHLPIGFILLAAIFKFYGQRDKYAFLNQALPLTLLLTMITAILAALFGWFLANTGSYDSSNLFWHRWLGILFAIISTLAWLWETERIEKGKKMPNWLWGFGILLLFITGHLGGNLTHGKGYLIESAPSFVKKIFAGDSKKDKATYKFPENPDSIAIYAHLIQPILNQKCTSCHNDEQQKGGLNLSSEENLIAGGDNGVVLKNGKPLESEIFKRITLSPNQKKFMPPKGIPMTYSEIKLLDYWISAGNSFEQKITDEEIPKDIQALLVDQYGLTTQKKTLVETASVSPIASQVLDRLKQEGIFVSRLAQGIDFLQVSIPDSLTIEKMESLLEIKEQLTWLNLGNKGLSDDWMKYLEQFPNLTRLRLEQNPISDEGLLYLKKLEYLESLNLYGTRVSDAGLSVLENMTSLKTLYLWQTKVTKAGADELKSKLPNLEVDLGTY